MLRLFRIAATLAASALIASYSSAQTIGCSVGAGNGALVPTSGTGGGGGTYPAGALPPFPGIATLNVASLPPGATHVTEVKVFGMTHTYVTDLQFVLTDPSGANHNLFCRAGTTTGGAYSCDFGGNYTFVAPCTVPVNALPATCTSPTIFTPGAYDQHFGRGTLAWPSGTNNIFNTPLSAVPAATGTWTLTVYDWVGADIGSFSSFDVCFGTPQSAGAPTSAPTLTSPASGASVFGPSVNLVWSSVDCATSYDVEVDGVVFASATTTYAYNSAAGSHTWRARGKNATGVGPWSASQMYTDLGAPPGSCNGPSVSTVGFIGGNGLGTNSAVYFDVDVLNPAGITVSQFDTNANATAGTFFTLEVWTKSGTYVGFEQNSAPWTLVASGAGVSTGNNTPSLVEFTDFPLPQGVTGFALRIIGAGHSYTNGNGSNQFFANADLSLTFGKSQGTLFSSTPITPRVWNGTFRYNCGGGPPTVYCTAGTSTNGCVPNITASGQPSASQASSCILSVDDVEGQKSGLVFYGIDNTGFTPLPWHPNSTSFFCVKGPVQRTPAQSSGGFINQCDGQLTLNWNAFQNAFPGSLGAPFSAGDKVYAQAWYRDPPAPRTTNLSDAVELTVAP